MESGGFGEPEKFPTEASARHHIDSVNAQLPGGPYPVFVCFAYQSKSSGKWAPIPDGCGDDPEWDPAYRKPAPGMIFRALREVGGTRATTLLVGDAQEDYEAARQAEVSFRWAGAYFNRGLER
jgi:hypothetical protein